jgi:2'-5' RNA ligase
MGVRFRCFFAVDLADEVRRAVVTARRELEGAGAEVRWSRPESLHVTLKFLGDVEAERIAAVAAAAESVVSGEAPFVMRAVGMGGFPSLERPRVLWAGLEAAALARLATALDAALAGLGLAAKEEPFRPHLTLGRVRSLRRFGPLRAALERMGKRDFGVSRVDRIVLYRSHLQPGGSVYEQLASLALAGAEEKEEGEANGHRQ